MNLHMHLRVLCLPLKSNECIHVFIVSLNVNKEKRLIISIKYLLQLDSQRVYCLQEVENKREKATFIQFFMRY